MSFDLPFFHNYPPYFTCAQAVTRCTRGHMRIMMSTVSPQYVVRLF